LDEKGRDGGIKRDGWKMMVFGWSNWMKGDEVVWMKGNEDVGVKKFKIFSGWKWREMKKLGSWWRNWKEKYGEGWVGKRCSSLPW
jgi:hypothetical protein